MKRAPFVSLVALVLLFSITQNGVAEAGYFLKINYIQPQFLRDVKGVYSPIFPVGSTEALAEKKKMLAYAKAGQKEIKKLLTDFCKTENFYNQRIKVKDARGGTSGLGNLKTIRVENIKFVEGLVGYPELSEEEAKVIEEEYEDTRDWPGYIEDGYVGHAIEANCVYSASISITSSVAYEVFEDDFRRGEYSRSELIKKKWILNYYM